MFLHFNNNTVIVKIHLNDTRMQFVKQMYQKVKQAASKTRLTVYRNISKAQQSASLGNQKGASPNP